MATRVFLFEPGTGTVPNALAHAECVVHSQHEAGDHDVVFGRVIRHCDRDGLPSR